MFRYYERPIADTLRARLAQIPDRLQILAGPRQVGKTTLIRQLLDDPARPSASSRYAAADAPRQPSLRDAATLISGTPVSLTVGANWVEEQWRSAEQAAKEFARTDLQQSKTTPFVLALDEIHTVPQWSRVVKGLWDASRDRDVAMHVLLLGSSPLLMQQGLTESLAGRFEMLRASHWSFEEMNAAFDLTLDQFIYFGGFPGSAKYMSRQQDWRDYVRDSLIEPSIQKDVLVMARVDKPALLRQVFEVGCNSSGQILAFNKMSGQLGGSVGTLAGYTKLLEQAGLLSALYSYAWQEVRKRASTPKFQVHNTALMTTTFTYDFEAARADRTHWGRLIESAVGAHLLNTAGSTDTRIHYWREGDLEVDFVVEHLGSLAAIEVKSGANAKRHRGLDAFCKRYPDARRWLVGTADLPLGEFLREPAAFWTR